MSVPGQSGWNGLRRVWYFWGALLASAVLLLITGRLLRPPFEVASPHLHAEGERYVAEFEVRNHTRAPVTRKIRVTLAYASGGGRHSIHFIPLESRIVTVTLSSKEERTLSCAFALPAGTKANRVELEVLAGER